MTTDQILLTGLTEIDAEVAAACVSEFLELAVRKAEGGLANTWMVVFDPMDPALPRQKRARELAVAQAVGFAQGVLYRRAL
ncbi:MAG: hypothetical protein HY646_13785 [Acidobacteria bacterium]|nr:hypothetical protein [Acidobacteriota bacterium]